MMAPALSVVIVNYNGGALLRECLTSLWAALEPGAEVLLVDNASTDGSLTGLEITFPGLQVIRNARNVGYARANNQALQRARGRYFLLLNPDVVLEREAVATAQAYLDAHADVSILGARVLRPDGRLDPPARRSFKTPSTYFYKMTGLARAFPHHPRFGRYYLSFLNEGEIHDVDSVVGAFLMIRRAAVERVGFLDERFFMYCEDEDWCWRVKRAGGRVVYHPGVVVHHRKGASTGQHPFRMLYHWHRSLFLYHRKNIAAQYPAPLNGLVYAGMLGGFLGALALTATRRLVRRRVPAL
jgi:GT2 family glycosyltransferase